MAYSEKDLNYAMLILRVALGLFFAIAGLAQLLNWAGFVDIVSGYAIIGGGTGSMAVVLPWIELVLGLMLIVGLATPLIGALVAFITFILAVVGGFTSGASLSKDIMFIAVALALMMVGAGDISLDGKIRGRKKK